MLFPVVVYIVCPLDELHNTSYNAGNYVAEEILGRIVGRVKYDVALTVPAHVVPPSAR